MYIHYRGTKLITKSGRPDEVNEAILMGDYLDKSTTYTEDGQEIPFVMPTRDEMIKQFIFPDWQQGDILVIADQPLKYPKLQGDTLVEMTRDEVCESGDLSILTDGEVYQDGKITYKAPPEDMLKPKWIYPDWIEQATEDEINLHLVETQYNEYEPLDTYSTVEQMKRQDPALAEEYVDMMIELRELRASMQDNNDSKYKVRTRRSVFSIHEPSEKLKLFKEKFSN